MPERERERERDFDIYQMLVGFDPGGITRTRRRPRSTEPHEEQQLIIYIEELLVVWKHWWMEILEKWREQRPPGRPLLSCMQA